MWIHEIEQHKKNTTPEEAALEAELKEWNSKGDRNPFSPGSYSSLKVESIEDWTPEKIKAATKNRLVELEYAVRLKEAEEERRKRIYSEASSAVDEVFDS